MYSTTFHLNTQELNSDIIDSIKTLFGKRNIEIIVRETLDETEYLLQSTANKKRLLKGIKESRQAQSLNTFSPSEFAKLNKQLLASKLT